MFLLLKMKNIYITVMKPALVYLVQYCISWNPRDHPVEDISLFMYPLRKKNIFKMRSLTGYLLSVGTPKVCPFSVEINKK